jgi:hypothetical protein
MSRLKPEVLEVEVSWVALKEARRSYVVEGGGFVAGLGG